MGDRNHFTTEVEFVDQLRDTFLNLIPERTKPLRFTQELAVGNRIADLAVLLPDTPAAEIASPPLTTRECVILAMLRRMGATRIDILEKRCHVHRSDFQTGTLKRLIDAGLVEFGRGGCVKLGQASWAGRVIAVEAKLRKWSQALSQAMQYLQYADYSYVALPAEYAKTAIANADRFHDASVGLMVLGTESLEVVVAARPGGCHNWRREFAVSRLISHGSTWSRSPTCPVTSSMLFDRLCQPV